MSLLRLMSMNTGSRLINLTKVSIIEHNGSNIIYTFSGTSSFFGSQKEIACYASVADAKSDFDSIVKDLNNLLQPSQKLL